MIKFVSNSSTSDDDSQWLSVSDIMAGLMMVFLFIAVVLMRTAFIERDKIKQVAVAYQENQVAIYDALVDEFESDLDKWDATIDQDSLTFTFKSPDILFADGSSSLSDEYQRLLGDFFPGMLRFCMHLDLQSTKSGSKGTLVASGTRRQVIETHIFKYEALAGQNSLGSGLSI